MNNFRPKWKRRHSSRRLKTSYRIRHWTLTRVTWTISAISYYSFITYFNIMFPSMLRSPKLVYRYYVGHNPVSELYRYYTGLHPVSELYRYYIGLHPVSELYWYCVGQQSASELYRYYIGLHPVSELYYIWNTRSFENWLYSSLHVIGGTLVLMRHGARNLVNTSLVH
jgi:hypothetical protein